MIVREIIGEAGTYEAIAPGDTATGISKSIRSPITGKYKGQHAVSALITIEGDTVTFTAHGVAPTAAAGTNVGHQLLSGDSMTLTGWETIKSFLVIDTVSGNNGTIKVTCSF